MKKGNKGYKIENYGRIFDGSERRKKKRIRNTVIFIIVVLLLVFLGYSISGPLSNLLKGKKTERPGDSSSEISSNITQNVSSQISEEEKEPQIPNGEVKAAYLPLQTAKDSAALTAYLDKIKALGYNSVILELKDESGYIYYQTQNQLALEVGAVSEAAIVDLPSVIEAIKGAGLTPVANINAFKDTVATKNMDAKIKYTLHEGWSWFDAANGKPWLNPYSETAQNYITALACELVELGFKDVMVSSIMFPNVSNFVNADFGPLEATVSHKDVLAKYTENLKAALNQKLARFILSYDGAQAKNDANVVYGTANPISFSADMYSPSLSLPSDSGAELSLYLGGIKAQYPTASVMAQFYSTDREGAVFTAEQITAQKSVCSGFSFYLCDKTGNYIS